MLETIIEEAITIIPFVIICGIVCIIVYIVQDACKGNKADTRRGKRSQNKTNEYIREKMIIDNKHCGDLQPYDSRGVFNGISGSFTDKTGKFSSAYQEEINLLNEKHGYRNSKNIPP